MKISILSRLRYLISVWRARVRFPALDYIPCVDYMPESSFFLKSSSDTSEGVIVLVRTDLYITEVLHAPLIDDEKPYFIFYEDGVAARVYLYPEIMSEIVAKNTQKPKFKHQLFTETGSKVAQVLDYVTLYRPLFLKEFEERTVGLYDPIFLTVHLSESCIVGIPYSVLLLT